jgi:hypothetical protein
LYYQAIQSLQLLIYGSLPTTPTLDRTKIVEFLLHQQRSCSHPPWISRRARGKAIERLFIDCSHIPDTNDYKKSTRKGANQSKKAASIAFRNLMNKLCQECIVNASASGSIGFSAIRNLARRLRQPLEQTLNPLRCVEPRELGIRFNGHKSDEVKCKSEKNTYSDWTPTTDYYIANSVVRDQNEPGSRCAYIGHEDEIDQSVLSQSLTVEELAMELYKTGRLPNGVDNTRDGTVKGGWTGWHNEGGIVRALFRILCGAPLLNMDFGNGVLNDMELYATVHLSPYQHGPFHLLVGYELQKIMANADDVESYYSPSPSFYCVCADKISQFLSSLEETNGQDLCDVVYDALATRLKYVCMNQVKDPFIGHDIVQVRTLSAIAAGFGGKCLAGIFRCLLFDYRHYSGGLPDLHLFRAMKSCQSTAHGAISSTLVDLGDWIGESFNVAHQQSYDFQRALHVLLDDEFLGLEKSSKPRVGQKNIASLQSPERNQQATILSMDLLPERLQLSHNGCLVEVECMMVEVKSVNE